MKKQKQKQNKTNIHVLLRLSKIRKMKSCYHMKDLQLLLQLCTFIDKGCGSTRNDIKFGALAVDAQVIDI